MFFCAVLGNNTVGAFGFSGIGWLGAGARLLTAGVVKKGEEKRDEDAGPGA